jgi:hypothetical protein
MKVVKDYARTLAMYQVHLTFPVQNDWHKKTQRPTVIFQSAVSVTTPDVIPP